MDACILQTIKAGSLVLLRNSQRDGRKGGKLLQRWLGPYTVNKSVGKGVYKLQNPETGKVLKKVVNVCRLKQYFSQDRKVPRFSDTSVFQTHTTTEDSSMSITRRPGHCSKKRRIESLSLMDDNVSPNEKGMNNNTDEADGIMVQESLASYTLYHVNACKDLSNTFQHLNKDAVENISRNEGLGDGGFNTPNYDDVLNINDCQQLDCNDLQNSTSFVQVGDVGFVNNDEGLNCTPSSVTEIYSTTICDKSDGFVTSTPKVQSGFFVPPPELSLSAVCADSFHVPQMHQYDIQPPTLTSHTLQPKVEISRKSFNRRKCLQEGPHPGML